MRLIDGDRIVTAQLYDDQYEEFKEEKMSIIDYVNMYTTEGVTTADDVLEQIRAEIVELDKYYDNDYFSVNNCPMYKCNEVLQIIDNYMK